VFLYSVATTGVYCRPSCAARPALRANVAFHDSREAAERQGFRACKRCRPDLLPKAEREAALIEAACRRIGEEEGGISLDDLAGQAGVSPFHFHRMFRRIVGVTPKAYAAGLRSAAVQSNLTTSGSVTSAIYDAGFSSSGRFYEAAPAMLGMTPTAWRLGGAGEHIWYATGRGSLGEVLVASTTRGICAILIGDTKDFLEADLRRRFPRAALDHDPKFASLLDRVIAYVDRPGDSIGLPLDIRGTAFQRQVWEVLQAIPAGETRTYSQIADQVGHPKAVRAVASACGANPLAVAVPCHRVVARDGGLAGYRWGVARKQALLAREKQ
jgi:AraC family transcriptional regulator of adaptative response/methylated-DNA-[protein]-cysteine methyltransferase